MKERLGPQKPNEVLKALERAGFYLDHQTGSHCILRHPDGRGPLVLPLHNRDMKTATLHAILKTANISQHEFIELL